MTGELQAPPSFLTIRNVERLILYCPPLGLLALDLRALERVTNDENCVGY